MNCIKEISENIISAVYPNTCVSCDEIIPKGEFFCDYCFEMLERIPAEKQCIKCGLEKKKCTCKRDVYTFDGITSPFYNNSSAKNAMYEYKFSKRMYISKFFAEQMSLCVKYSFYGMRFDGICYVPLSLKSFRKRGFNQSYEIAKGMSEILGIPLIIGQLGCRGKRKTQHKLNMKERKLNVKGKYYSKRRIAGRILLIDDIKTTGATLNECAKQLLNSGANSVYCVTALITQNKHEKKG